MARVYSNGGEIQSVVGEGGSSSGSIISSISIFRSGKASNKHNSDAGNAVAWQSEPGNIDESYGRVYLYFENSLPTTNTQIVAMLRTIASDGYSIRITSSGQIGLWDNIAATQIGSNWTGTIQVNVWYKFDIYAKSVSGSNNDIVGAKVNNESFASTITGTDTGAAYGFVWGWITAPGANLVVYADDIARNDVVGSFQNSWCGDGKIVILLPVSDNARTAEWTGGVGGTTNLFEAINNTPPTGTATETDLTQIEHAGGATGTYSANMGAYSDSLVSNGGGMSSTNVILLIQYIVVVGEDVAQGTKLLAIAGGSNPTVAQSANFDVGSAALGTYPTNWTIKVNALAIQYSPSIVLGTKPIMRVVRPETATRVASVCFMGMLVEYTSYGTRTIVGSRQTRATSRASFY